MTQSGRPNLDQNLRFPVGPITTMKQINLAQTINTIANVGVIAGLVFVGLQLKQDRKVAEITSLLDGTNTRMYWVELVRESPEVWVKGLAGEPLSPMEAAEFEQVAISWELFHYTAYVTQPILGIDPMKFVREWALQLYSHPGLLAWWERYRKRSLYTQPTSPSDPNPWFDAVDEEMKRLEADPPQID